MAELINILLGIWQSVVAVICIVIAIIAGRKYLERKNKVSRLLFVAFLFASLAAVFQASPTLIEDVFELELASSSDWVNLYIIQEFMYHQFGYFFLCISVYFLFLFSMDLLLEDDEKINIVIKIIPFAYIIILIIYGIFIQPLITITNDLAYILSSIDAWVGLFIVVLMIPTTAMTIRILRRIPKKDAMRKRVVFILLFAISIIVLIVNFVVESFMPNQPNVFSFIAWIFAVTALVEAYLGLYR